MSGTLVSQIISDAYREANITALGTSPTTNQNNEALTRLNSIVFGALGFEIGELEYDWLAPAPQRTAQVAANYPQAPYPMGADPTILSFPIASDFDPQVYPYPPKNSRIVWGGNTLKVYFPENPDNGSRMSVVQGSGAGDDGQTGNILTLDGNGKYIGAPGTTQATFTFNAGVPIPSTYWLYISDYGFWRGIATLALTDTLPFPTRFDDYWVTTLMFRLAPRYNKKVSDETVAWMKLMEQKMKQAFRQSQVTVYGSFDFPRSLQSYISGYWYW